MSDSIPAASAGDSSDAVGPLASPLIRPLPPKPSLELERKRAKALLRQLRDGDPDVLTWARARHPATFRSTTSGAFKLADVQHIIAREYGFASWPRLVRYFGEVEREAHLLGSSQGHERTFYDRRVESLLAQHRGGVEWAGRALAAFVPRFYGQTFAEVLAAPVTVDDARLAVAREDRYTSWDGLLEAADGERERRGDPWQRNSAPFMRAVQAANVHDLAAVQAIVGEHPELLSPSEDDQRRGHSLVFNALIIERQKRAPEARTVTDWLVSQGVDLTGPLNLLLLGFHQIKTVEVQYLLDRGADPTWTAPNGVTVLEHALVRYWNGEAVDLIARRVTPRRALWIAAGLGDVDGVRQFLDRQGKPTRAAYRDRPDFGLMGPRVMPMLPEPDDAELLSEAMLIATLNGRAAAMELLVDCGVSVDSMAWGTMPLMCLAVDSQTVGVVETLVRLGANLDLEAQHPRASARQFARQRFIRDPENPVARRILELCGGGDPDQLLADLEARRPSPPPPGHQLREALELAGDDALRRGQSDVRPENLFIGVLRLGSGVPLSFLSGGGVDAERLRVAIGDRVDVSRDKVAVATLPLDPDARVLVQRAISVANERRQNEASALHLLYAFAENESGAVAELLTAAGGSLSRIRHELARV